MNWNRKPVRAPKDPSRPTKVIVRNPVEESALLARADQLHKVNGKWELLRRGDYKWTAVNVLGQGTGNGGLNGHYEYELTWHEPEQPNLI